jgi:hypothetical protein
MNQTKNFRTEAERVGFDCEIDRILSANDELFPSSGFLAAVMERVQQQAAAPAPIPFPWKRALPGFLAAAGVFGWGGYELIHLGLLLPSDPASKTYIPFSIHLPAALIASASQTEWVAMALGVSLLSWLLARRLAG